MTGTLRSESDAELPKLMVLPVMTYAERFPTLPVFNVVECLLDAWRDAITYVDDDWNGSFDQLATQRLTDRLTAGAATCG